MHCPFLQQPVCLDGFGQRQRGCGSVQLFCLEQAGEVGNVCASGGATRFTSSGTVTSAAWSPLSALMRMLS